MYLAPEAITTPDAVDERTDIYALGAVAYFLLAGQDAFSGETVVELLSRHMLQAPQPPSVRLAKPLPGLCMVARSPVETAHRGPSGRPALASDHGR